MSLTRHTLSKVQQHQSTHRTRFPFGLKLLAVIFVSLMFSLFVVLRYPDEFSTVRRIGCCQDGPQKLGDFKRFEILMKIRKKKMVFIETSEGQDFCLKLRQSCAVESAARTNTEAAVVLLLRASSISHNCTTFEELEKLPNVVVIGFTIDEVFEGTPLQEWGQRVQSGEVKSPYMKSHLSDALRLAVVHKYSAVYLDLDFIVLRSFDQLFAYEGFLAREGGADLNGALIGFRGLRNFTSEAMIEFSSTYRGREWGFNGPALMRRVIEKWGCRTSDVSCKGVTILNPIAFYPVHYLLAHRLFADNSAEFSSYLLNDEKIFAVHFWNHFTSRIGSPVHHTSVLNICGQMKCPSTFQLVTKTKERNFI